MSRWREAPYWQERFNQADTPWELGAYSTVLIEGIEELIRRGVSLRGSSVLVPGCGRGSDALELGRRGAHVVAIDWTETAVEETRRRWKKERGDSWGEIECVQGNFFEVPPRIVDLVAEHTFFCAIDPSDRERYVERVAAWLRPSGYLVGNFFVLSEREAEALSGLSLVSGGGGGVSGPPFVTTRKELETRLAPWFTTLTLRQAVAPDPHRRPDMEWVGIFQRKPA